MAEFLRRHPLPCIVLAQLFGTSLWFSINGVWLSLSRELGLEGSLLGSLTLAVQSGFIIGTLLFAITGLADRFAGGKLSARDLTAILGAGLRGGGNAISDDELARMSVEGGLRGAAEIAVNLLKATFGDAA